MLPVELLGKRTTQSAERELVSSNFIVMESLKLSILAFFELAMAELFNNLFLNSGMFSIFM